MSESLDNPVYVKQTLDYGKNSSTRWVVLTNFLSWRVFNSDYFDQLDHAELCEFCLEDILSNDEAFVWLLLLSRESGWPGLDAYAKKHKKWKESADIKDLLTSQLLEARRQLAKAIFEQNKMKFDTGVDAEAVVDECVQHIFDRIIFCRMLEDTGIDPNLRIQNELVKWKEGDKRIQFYRDFLCPFFLTMHKKYDSTIFDQDRIDRLSIKNDDFIPLFERFYVHESGLHYDFGAIGMDVLGHAYENYLSYRVKKTEKRTDVVKAIYVRKQAGIYYTPEFLVDHLVRSTLGAKLRSCRTVQEALNLRVLDPACGSGTFLVRAYEEFRAWYVRKHGHEEQGGNGRQMLLDSENGMSGFLDRVLEQCIFGIDKDSRATRLTRLNLFLRATDNPKQLPSLNIIERDTLVADTDFPQAFVFERDFPLVHEKGGFDVILGNPPWEKWKPDSQEFFEEQDPGFKSLPTQEAKKRMQELFKKRPYLKKEWNAKLEEFEAYSTYYRENYAWQVGEVDGRKEGGDIDLYKLFTEKAYVLAKEGGMIGFLVPSGVYTDLGAKGLRAMLFEHCQLKGMYSFENRNAIFPDIHRSYKYVLLSFAKGGHTIDFPAAFFLLSKDELDQAVEHPTQVTVEFVKKSSPSSWNVLEIKTLKDYAIVQRMLIHPFLGETLEKTWNITMQSGFHMTNDSHLFRQLPVGFPLLEGKNIHQFTHQWKEAPKARYYVSEKDALANLKEGKRFFEGYWLAYRLIASSTNERTLICTVVPPGYVCGHSIAIVKMPTRKSLCYLSGVLNSFVVDYFMRQKISANVTMFNFKELPVPRLMSGELFETIARMAGQLVATTGEFAELKKELGISYGVTKETEREELRARLDVAVAKLYKMRKEELAYILTKFPLVDDGYKKKVILEY